MSGLLANAPRCWRGLWLLSATVGLSFDDEFVAGGHEPIDGGLCEQRVAHDGDLLNITEIATLGHRHFRAVRPRHTQALTLLP